MIRVMLADDHRIVREGVRRVLACEPNMQIIGEASSGEEALILLTGMECDVLVMDLIMPGLHGRELVERIRAAYPRLGLVIFSMYPEDPFALNFLRMGVHAFVSKEREPQYLVESICLAAQGKCFLPERFDSTHPSRLSQNTTPHLDDPRRLKLGLVTIDMEEGHVQHPSRPSSLSTQELAVLAYLAERRGRTISRDELLRDVWGYSASMQTRTVEMTISRLRRKIEIDAVNPRFILTIHGDGYRLERDET